MKFRCAFRMTIFHYFRYRWTPQCGENLVRYFWDEAQSKTMVNKWFAGFNRGWPTSDDDLLEGRSCNSVFAKNIDVVRKMFFIKSTWGVLRNCGETNTRHFQIQMSGYWIFFNHHDDTLSLIILLIVCLVELSDKMTSPGSLPSWW